MQKDIHPEYREVLFHDKSMDYYFIVRSTLKTDETKEWEDGKTYPYCVLDISSASHPFYTGKQKLVDTGGRVDKFRKRFGNKTKPTPEAEMASEEEPARFKKLPKNQQRKRLRLKNQQSKRRLKRQHLRKKLNQRTLLKKNKNCLKIKKDALRVFFLFNYRLICS